MDRNQHITSAGAKGVTTLSLKGPNHALLQNAAMSAQSRRRHVSPPRIRHWLEDVVEASRLSTPFIFDENDEPVLSPLSPGRRVKDNGLLLLGPKVPVLPVYSPAQFDRFPVHKHKSSLESFDDSDGSSGGTFFSDSEAVSDRESRSRHRARPNLTIKVNNSRYKSKYCVSKDRMTPSPTASSVYSHAAASPIRPPTRGKTHRPRRRASPKLLLFPTPPPLHARGVTEMLAPMLVNTRRGVEEVKAPMLNGGARKLSHLKSEMEEQSARMLDAAVTERSRTPNYLGDYGVMVRRQVLMEAVGRAVNNGLGYESYGVVGRKM